MPTKQLTINGIPVLGFGTWPLSGSEGRAALEMALAAGYRHIDTAQMYGNEADVGHAIAASRLARTDLFVTTKINAANLAAGRFLPSVKKSLDDLRLDRVDLLLIHWPPADPAARDEAIDRLNQAAESGLATRIGVSNFPIAYMRRAAARSARKLAVNQVEFHPLLDQSKLKAAADELGIALCAYCPVARGRVLTDPAVESIALRLGEAASSVVLAWTLAQGVVVLPKATNPVHAKANLRALGVKLTAVDMAAISALTKANQRIVSPADMAGVWDR